MSVFHDIRFPIRIGFGARASIERRTEIITLASGQEERNSPWAHGRRRWDVGTGLTKIEDIYVVQSFFEARKGALHGFRFKDFLDHQSASPKENITPTDQLLGTGDGSQTDFQLIKSYGDVAGSSQRAILRPVSGSVQLALNGVLQNEGGDYSLNESTGQISFSTAPASGTAVSAGYEFDIPVRFDLDRLDIRLSEFEAGQMPSIPLIEIHE